MSVFVDELKLWLPVSHVPSTSSAHLTADTLAELHAFARRIGLRKAWFQPASRPHYDLTPARRAKAISAGAIFVPAKEQARKRILGEALP